MIFKLPSVDQSYPLTHPESIMVISFAKRLLTWTLICCVAAAPSFMLAYEDYHRQVGAMITGIVIFVLAYTLLTGTEGIERFNRLRSVSQALKVGFGSRVAISILYPLALFFDLFCGMASIEAVKTVLGNDRSFTEVLAITLVQGLLLNAVIAVIALVSFSIMRMVGKGSHEGSVA